MVIANPDSKTPARTEGNCQIRTIRLPHQLVIIKKASGAQCRIQRKMVVHGLRPAQTNVIISKCRSVVAISEIVELTITPTKRSIQ